MDRGGVVAITLQVALNYGLKGISFQVWPGQALRVKQHFLNVLGEPVPVPDAEMAEFMSAQKKAFQVQRGKYMVDLRHPLRHAVVVGIFRPKREFLEAAPDCR